MATVTYQTDRVRLKASIDGEMARLAGLEAVMLTEVPLIVYAATKTWFDTRGEGHWPKLATSTKINKTAQGCADPPRPLYAEGNLYHSVTSRSGPYSRVTPLVDGVMISANWQKNGINIPEVLAKGTKTAGKGHTTVIPSRPIWPPPMSVSGTALRETLADLLLGKKVAAWPGANVGRGAGGRFISLK